MTYRIPGLTVYRDEPGEGAGGGGKPPAAISPEQVTALHNSIAGLDGTMKAMLTLAQTRQQTPQPEPEPEEDDDDLSEGLTEAELEALPRKAFTDYLLSKFQQNLKGVLKPLEDQVQAVGSRTTQTALEVQAREFANKTPDFAEWRDEMMAIAKDNPTLPINRIYALARVESPEKAAKIDAEATKVAKAAKEAAAEGNSPPRRRTAPMAPSGGSGESKPTKMTPQQAAEAAWADTLAQFGDPFS